MIIDDYDDELKNRDVDVYEINKEGERIKIDINQLNVLNDHDQNLKLLKKNNLSNFYEKSKESEVEKVSNTLEDDKNISPKFLIDKNNDSKKENKSEFFNFSSEITNEVSKDNSNDVFLILDKSKKDLSKDQKVDIESKNKNEINSIDIVQDFESEKRDKIKINEKNNISLVDKIVQDKQNKKELSSSYSSFTKKIDFTKTKNNYESFSVESLEDKTAFFETGRKNTLNEVWKYLYDEKDLGNFDLSSTSGIDSSKSVNQENLEHQFAQLIQPSYKEEISFLEPLNNSFGKNTKRVELIHQKLLYLIEKGKILSESTYKYLGFYYFKSSRYYEGIRLIESKIDDFESKGFFFNILANFYYNVDGLQGKSVSFFKKALIHGNLLSTYLSLGYYYIEQNKISKALAYLNVSEKHFGCFLPFLLLKAQCYEIMNSYDQAIFYYSSYLKKKFNPNLFNKLGLLNYKKKNWEEALKYFNQDEKSNFSIEDLVYKKAISYFFISDIKQSINELSQIVEIKDKYLDKIEDEDHYTEMKILYNLFLTAYNQDIYDEMTFECVENLCEKMNISYQEFLERDFSTDKIKNISLLLNIANQYFRKKQIKTSFQYVKQILTLNKQFYPALCLLGKIWYLSDNMKDKSLKLFMELDYYRQDDSEINFYLGEYYFKQTDFKKAILYFERIVDLHEENKIKFYEYCGQSYLKLDQIDQARFHLQIAYKLNSENYDLQIELANEYLKKNNYQRSIILLENILKVVPNNKKAKELLSESYVQFLNDEFKNELKK